MLSPGLATRLVAEFRQKGDADEKLSEREKEVLKLVGLGLTNAEVGERLFIGESTVRTHLQRILYKLHLKNREKLSPTLAVILLPASNSPEPILNP